jgi:hypothetical protein
MLFYFEFSFPFPSVDAKNTEFAVSQHLRDNKSTQSVKEDDKGGKRMRQNMHTPFLAVDVNRKEYLENVGMLGL